MSTATTSPHLAFVDKILKVALDGRATERILAEIDRAGSAGRRA